jgi:hypothetical protein
MLIENTAVVGEGELAADDQTSCCGKPADMCFSAKNSTR